MVSFNVREHILDGLYCSSSFASLFLLLQDSGQVTSQKSRIQRGWIASHITPSTITELLY